MAISKVLLNDVTQMDITDTDAEITDVINKYFYGADGVKRLGTASAGGGNIIPQGLLSTNTYIGWCVVANEEVSLSINPTVADGITIDWGDGATTTTDTLGEKSYAHTYTAAGEYMITIIKDSGYFALYDGCYGGNGATGIRWVKIGQYCDDISGAFAYANGLIEADLSDASDLTTIGGSTFRQCCSLRRVSLPDGITSLGARALQATKLSEVIIPDSVTSIGGLVLANMSDLSSITLGSGLLTIGAYAFSASFSKLRSITIPASVTFIDTAAFGQAWQGCLEEIHFKGTTPPEMESHLYSDISTDTVIYVPTGYLNAYTSANNYPDPNTYTYVEE